MTPDHELPTDLEEPVGLKWWRCRRVARHDGHRHRANLEGITETVWCDGRGQTNMGGRNTSESPAVKRKYDTY